MANLKHAIETHLMLRRGKQYTNVKIMEKEKVKNKRINKEYMCIRLTILDTITLTLSNE